MRKKLVICFLLVVSLLTAQGMILANAETTTEAEMRGYSLSDKWCYRNGFSKQTTVYGPNNVNYGTIWTWAEMYQYYDESAKELYVLSICTAEMQPYLSGSNIINNKSMHVTMYPSWISGYGSTDSIDYAPKTTAGSYSESTSVTTGWHAGSNGIGGDFSNTHEVTTSTSDVQIIAYREEPAMVRLHIEHNFVNYANNQDKNIYRALVSYSHMMLYKISNYDLDEEPILCYYVYHTSSFYNKTKRKTATATNTTHFDL